jgi:hypothetical protein
MDLRSKKEFVTKITEAVFSVRYGLEIKEAAKKNKNRAYPTLICC